ncbi:hypothetical protein LJC59_03325 [Desulfovibrio sp. OttesenSCG-928-A18]|nr:hypothetical protein [Desulfovibrio sp. OttesenSCG-928-A18]
MSRNPAFSFIASLSWPVWAFLVVVGFYTSACAGLVHYSYVPELLLAWEGDEVQLVRERGFDIALTLASVLAYVAAAVQLLRRKAVGFRLARGAALGFMALVPAQIVCRYLLHEDSAVFAGLLQVPTLVQMAVNLAFFLYFLRAKAGSAFS